MAARYIPPGRRNKGEARGHESTRATVKKSTASPEPTTGSSHQSYLAEDIYHYFSNGTETPHYNISTTLHASASSPDSLAYVSLFPGANPRWATDNILFVKSNLDLIRTGSEVENEPSTARELPRSVAVFEQARRGQPARFAFIGWYKVTNVQFLSPRTPDLVRMLEQKWSKTDRYGNVSQREREGDAWVRSLSQHWAVVKFEKDEAAEKEKGDFDIPEKSVIDLLQEMRLGESAASGADDANTGKGNQGDTPLTELDANVQSGNVEALACKEVPAAKVN